MSNFFEHFPDDVREEIENWPQSVTHGRPSTYNLGCRGPLCRKANRERIALLSEKRRKAQGLPPTKRASGYAAVRARDAELNLFLELYLVWRTTTRVA
jgi:hypothetical protein